MSPGELPDDKLRFGCLQYRKQTKKWFTETFTGWRENLKTKHVTLSADRDTARAMWIALLAENGYPRPDGHKWRWNSQRQKWVTGLDYVPRGKRLEMRRLAYSKLQSDKRKAIDERQTIISQAFQRAAKMKADAERKLKEHLKTRRCEAFVPGVAKLEPTEKELQGVAYRQFLCPMKYHTPTKSWFAWIGVRNRKVVMLGHDKDAAFKAWLLLKHCLEGGSRLLLSALQQRRDSSPGPCEAT